jgi:hypothetical protein
MGGRDMLHEREDVKLVQISVGERVDKRLYFKMDSKQIEYYGVDLIQLILKLFYNLLFEEVPGLS